MQKKINQIIKKEPVAKPVIGIKPEKYFYLRDGQVLKNIKELVVALEKMSDNVFNHHVTKDRNDFVNWVKGVFNEGKLAIDLNKAKTAKEAAKILKTYGF